jgi:hypothetical protein
MLRPSLQPWTASSRRCALRRGPSFLRSPANLVEDHEEPAEFGPEQLLELLSAISAAAHEADLSNGSLVAAGD